MEEKNHLFHRPNPTSLWAIENSMDVMGDFIGIFRNWMFGF